MRPWASGRASTSPHRLAHEDVWMLAAGSSQAVRRQSPREGGYRNRRSTIWRRLGSARALKVTRIFLLRNIMSERKVPRLHRGDRQYESGRAARGEIWGRH